MPYVDNSYKWAGGGLLSTVGDLLVFANHLLSCYQTNEKTNFLKQSTVRDQLWSKQNEFSCKTKYLAHADTLPIIQQNESFHYALGWIVCMDNDQKIKHVYHTGGALGCVSVLMIKPIQNDRISTHPSGIAVAIFCNSGDASDIGKLALNITEIFSYSS